MNWLEFRSNYLWGNNGLHKFKDIEAAFRYKRNIQLILNLDENKNVLNFNQKFNLRLNLRKLNTSLEKENYKELQYLLIRKIISESLNSLKRNQKELENL